MRLLCARWGHQSETRLGRPYGTTLAGFLREGKGLIANRHVRDVGACRPVGEFRVRVCLASREVAKLSVGTRLGLAQNTGPRPLGVDPGIALGEE